MHNNLDLPLPPPFAELVAAGPVAVFLDFDGTLIEIAETPDGIAVPSELARQLETLAALLDGRLALVSGRSLADLGGHIGEVAVTMVGSHGTEFGDADVASHALSRNASDQIAALSAQWPALLVEVKPHGVAVHYRQEPDASASVISVMNAIAESDGLAARQGKMVVELVPRDASKGNAVRQLMADARFAGAIPIFIGDDITDEDGFAAVAALGGHGILVGSPRTTFAHFRLATPQQVHSWLAL